MYLKRVLSVITLILILLAGGLISPAQTTITLSNTVLNTVQTPRFSINFSDEAPYGSQHHLRDLGVAVGGYMPGEYWVYVSQCNSSVTQTTTSWTDQSGTVGTQAYPAGFFTGASYTAYNYQGTILGTGTITGSTANTGSNPITFTLGTAISAPCQTANSADMLEVRWFNAPDSLASPFDIFSNLSGTASWNTTDLDPSAPNTLHTLQLAPSASLQLGFDQGLANSTNTTSTSGVSWLNVNGTGYVYKLRTKCLAASGTGSLQIGLARGSTTYVATQTITPTCSNTAGSGWALSSFTFNGSETGSQSGNIIGTITNTGSNPILVSYETMIEPTVMTPTNTTAYRDAVVKELQKFNPGQLRDMDVATWCSNVNDQIQPQGNVRWCSPNSFVKNNFFPATSYTDFLNLCLFLGVDAWISTGQHIQGSDMAQLITWLSTSGFTASFKAKGLHIRLEYGNEPWNSGSAGNLWGGNGPIYGNALGVVAAAGKAATGYDSSVITFVGAARSAPNQGCGTFGWTRNIMTESAITGSKPDMLDGAPYNFNWWSSFTASGSALSPTSSSLTDMLTEVSNWTTPGNTTCGGGSSNNETNMTANNAYATGTWSVPLATYEMNQSDNQGTAVINQLQMNEQSASVVAAIAVGISALGQRQDSGMTGPINLFTLSENANGYTCQGCSTPGVVMPKWGMNRMMADGPGQTGFTVDRPDGILFSLINNAIGVKNNVMTLTYTSPTYNYAGGQTQSGSTACSGSTDTICPNATAPFLKCSFFRDATTNYALICFNSDISASHAITLAGVVPVGTVTQTVFPNSGNTLLDNNEQSWVGAPSAVVGVPTPTATSGNSYTLAPASALILQFSTSSSGSTNSAIMQGAIRAKGKPIIR